MLWARHSAKVRVSQPQCYWHLGSNNGCGSCPARHRTFSSIPSLYPLDGSSIKKNVCRYCRMSPWESKRPPVENPYTKCFTYIISYTLHSSPMGKSHHCPHFTNKKTESLVEQVGNPRSARTGIQGYLILKHSFTSGQYKFPSHLWFMHRFACFPATSSDPS